jgi:hypothetical protein
MVTSKPCWIVVLGALAVVALLAWVARGPGSTPSTSAPPSREEPPPATKQVARALPEVSTLYEQATSAYHARLFADDDGVVLVTEAGFTTFVRGEPPVTHAVSLGPVAARQGGALVFWRSGALRSISLSGGDERGLAALPTAPQYLLAAEGQLAWIQIAEKSGTKLQTLAGGEERVVYESDERVTAAVLRASVIYWVSVRGDGSWLIRRVGLDGQHTSTETHRGRPPAMLALGPDGVYFYDGRERGVRRLTFDLARETSVLANVICSPLVVSSRVFCAHVGGIFDIPPSSSVPRLLTTERAGPVTAMAATNDHLFWIAEADSDRLVMRSAVVTEP